MAQQQRVKVLRGFRHRQEIQGPGTVLDLELGLAKELRSCNKVEFVPSDTKLHHTEELPDPNKVLADRQAKRNADLAALQKSAEKSAEAGAKTSEKHVGGK